jgi:hypothetical protein
MRWDEMRRPSTLIIVALTIWVGEAAIFWAWGAPLGHDEAQYALAARAALGGKPPPWGYLSYGMNLLAIPGVLLGGSEQALRWVPLCAGCGFAAAVAGLTRRISGATTVGAVLLLLAGTHCIARRSAELLSDMPACACLLMATAIAVHELGGETPPRWRVMWMAPWCAAAFYLRYGSCLSIVVLGAVVLAVNARAVLSRPGPVVATLATFAALLIPHAWMSTRATGTPWRILLQSSRVITQARPPTPLAYLDVNPLWFYGVAAVPVLLIGFAVGLRALDRRRRMAWLLAMGQWVAVGFTAHAQSRYVLTSLVLLMILGVDAFAHQIGTAGAAARRWLKRIAAALVVLSLLEAMVPAIRARPVAGTMAAAAVIRSHAAGARCSVLGRHTTQLEWYSGCAAVTEVDAERVRDQAVFVVTMPGEASPGPLGAVGDARPIFQERGVTVARVTAPQAP